MRIAAYRWAAHGVGGADGRWGISSVYSYITFGSATRDLLYYLSPCRFLSALLLRGWFAHEVVSGGSELLDRLTTPDRCAALLAYNSYSIFQ